jgi:hypothetical protein
MIGLPFLRQSGAKKGLGLYTRSQVVYGPPCGPWAGTLLHWPWVTPKRTDGGFFFVGASILSNSRLDCQLGRHAQCPVASEAEGGAHYGDIFMATDAIGEITCRKCSVPLSAADIWKLRLTLREAALAVGKRPESTKWLASFEPICWGCAIALPDWPEAQR